MKTKTSALPDRKPLKLYLAIAAVALALLAIPHAGHAQGVFRGGEQGGRDGVRQGGRAAGPVGAVVGGALGVGVGAAIGGVNGVLGLDGGRRCRGFYDRRHRFHCYR
jgi:O-antigen/teichoic acid export membrane protein